MSVPQTVCLSVRLSEKLESVEWLRHQAPGFVHHCKHDRPADLCVWVSTCMRKCSGWGTGERRTKTYVRVADKIVYTLGILSNENEPINIVIQILISESLFLVSIKKWSIQIAIYTVFCTLKELSIMAFNSIFIPYTITVVLDIAVLYICF